MLVYPIDLIGYRVVLFFLGEIDRIREFNPLQPTVRWDRYYSQIVNLAEFLSLGHRSTGHTTELLVELEEVLQGDRRKRLRLVLDLHLLLRFNRLMQPIRPLPAFHQSARKFIDDDDLTFAIDVVDIALVKLMGFQCIVDQVRPFHVSNCVETLNSSKPLRFSHPSIGQVHRVIFFIDDEMLFALQPTRDAVSFDVLRRIASRGTRNDQRRSRFVNENIVDFVNDRVLQWTLHLLHETRELRIPTSSHSHVVAQIVKSKLIVRRVGDVRRIGSLPLVVLHPTLNVSNS